MRRLWWVFLVVGLLSFASAQGSRVDCRFQFFPEPTTLCVAEQAIYSAGAFSVAGGIEARDWTLLTPYLSASVFLQRAYVRVEAGKPLYRPEGYLAIATGLSLPTPDLVTWLTRGRTVEETEP
jgi:hypothetical protein